MPLIPKKSAIDSCKHSGQSALIPKRNGLQPKMSAIISANINHVYNHTRKDKHLHDMITYYLKTFSNIINGRINKAINKYRCLQVRPAEMKEELIAKFQMKFSRAIIDRSIQLWRVTDKSMNVYIQTMVDRLITDEVRTKTREQSHCKDLTIVLEDPDILFNNINNNIAPTSWLNGVNAESDMLVQELWEMVLTNLEKYEPDKLPILRRVLDPNTEVNFSSPSVHALKITIKAILKDLR
jgi:hypothetical protein